MQFGKGTVIGGRYTLERLLGQGGMSDVWAARDALLDRQVAVKLLRRDLGDQGAATTRFNREARTLAQVRSPHVVEVFDTGTEDGTAYIVMALVAGEGLDAYLRRVGRLGLAAAYDLLEPVLLALGAAHSAGIVHRDLKPSNIAVEPDGRGGVGVKVLDFGIAKILDDPAAANITAAGQIFGTPSYMSPEQALGGSVGPYTDLWAAGVVAYEVLTGRRPFDGTSFGGALRGILFGTFTQPSALVPELGPAVDAFFTRALARDPADRFQAADEMLAAFAELAGKHPASQIAHATLPAVHQDDRKSYASATGPLEITQGMAEPAARQAVLSPTQAHIPVDPWAGLDGVLPGGLADDASTIQRFLDSLFSRIEPVADRVARLHGPRFDDGARSHQFFAVFMADGARGDRRLLTRTFIGYAGSLEQQLEKIDARTRKVVLAIVDSTELGAGVRQQIFRLNRRFAALVLPINVGQIRAAVDDGTALALFREGLSDFHTFPDVFAVGARAVDPTAFFGLGAVVNDLVRHLEGTPLISLWGPPGSGKTSLVEKARSELPKARFHRVRCVEAPDRTIAALAGEIAVALGAPGDAGAGIRERIEAAAHAAKERAATAGQKAVLVLEDADPCLAPLVSEHASDAERSAARALWLSLWKQCSDGTIAVIATSLSGFVLTEPKLLDWMNPLANQVTRIAVPPLARGEVTRMVRDLGLQINVTFSDAAVERVYALSAGNVYVVRRICQQVTTPRRRETALSPLEEIRLSAADVDRGGRDLAAIGDTFRGSVLPWLDLTERLVLEVVAARKPRDAKSVADVLAGQCPRDACAAGLDRLRRMGFVERRDDRDRVAIPLLEAWVKHNLAPAPGEAERRRGERVRSLGIGASITLLLVGGYWVWSLPRETSWRTETCRYELDYPSRAAAGAELKLHAFRACDAAEAKVVALVARPGTFARIGKDAQPTFALQEPGRPDWRQLEVPATFDDVGKSRFELDVTVDGVAQTTILVRVDWLARLPAVVQALLAVVGVIPAAIGAVLAYHREVLALVRRLFGQLPEAAVKPEA